MQYFRRRLRENFVGMGCLFLISTFILGVLAEFIPVLILDLTGLKCFWLKNVAIILEIVLIVVSIGWPIGSFFTLINTAKKLGVPIKDMDEGWYGHSKSIDVDKPDYSKEQFYQDLELLRNRKYNINEFRRNRSDVDEYPMPKIGNRHQKSKNKKLIRRRIERHMLSFQR